MIPNPGPEIRKGWSWRCRTNLMFVLLLHQVDKGWKRSKNGQHLRLSTGAPSVLHASRILRVSISVPNASTESIAVLAAEILRVLGV